MELFVDDDRGYFDWLSEHPEGFVINTTRKPSPSNLMLHLASCDHIADRSVANYTKQYAKACSDSRYELLRWAREEVGGTASNCYSCAP